MTQLQSFIRETWQSSIVPALKEYIAIPNESPAFDPRWQEHGHMDRAVDLFSRWATAQEIPGMELHVARAEGRTPPERVKILRTAFMKTMRDPQFLADAKKTRLYIDPSPGEEVLKVVKSLDALSPEVVTKLKSILFPKRK